MLTKVHDAHIYNRSRSITKPFLVMDIAKALSKWLTERLKEVGFIMREAM